MLSRVPFELKAPAGLWLLGLLAPLVVLYVLKIRRQRVTVSSTWLWAAAARDLAAKSPFKRLVPQVPLLLELLALALLALALARPASRAGHIAGEHVAIVLDTSASMATIEPDGRSRLAHARDAASAVIAALAPGAQAVIVDAGRDAHVVSPMDSDRRRLEASLAKLEASDAEGSMSQAIATASSQLRPYERTARLIVVSDGALADRDAFASSNLPLELVRVGSPVDNAAIVRLDIANSDDPTTHREQVQAFAMVQNFGQKTRSLYVTLSMRNVVEPLASRRIDLGPGERAPVVLGFEPARGDAGAGLIVELSPHDALSSDDRAFGRVPSGAKLTVVMAPAQGSPWVARALASDPNVELLGSSLAGLPGAGVPRDALVVLNGACPADAPGGDLLILDPPPGPCGTALVGAKLVTPLLTSWAEVDPRLRFLSLDGVDLRSARRLEADTPQGALVQSREGTLIADASSPGRSITLVGFDVGESNWPLKASFVLFMRNVVELARSHRVRGAEAPGRVGDAYSLRVPVDVAEVDLESPGGSRQKLSARDGLCVVPNLRRAGFYFASYGGKTPGSALFAANLTSERESDLRPHELPTRQGNPLPARSAAELSSAVTDWSWPLAAVSLLLIALDVWWVTRTPRTKALSLPRAPDRESEALR
ncbi:MAG TPA: VWA domain-containing protein [Polyangiaceae bacterium]|nr:VWA domain-containing protein [Polyangiaceae bacterium]